MNRVKTEPPSRKFKGIWISKEIWLHPDLKKTEIIFLAEIDSLSDEVDATSASRQYLASFMAVSDARISNMVSSLKKRGFLIGSLEAGVGLKLNPKFTENVKVVHEKRELKFTENVNSLATPYKRREKREHTQKESACDFEKFFAGYPQQENKQEALEQWIKLQASGLLPAVDVLLRAVSVDVQTNARWVNPQYIQFAAKWLRNKPWLKAQKSLAVHSKPAAKPTCFSMLGKSWPFDSAGPQPADFPDASLLATIQSSFESAKRTRA